MDNQNIRWEQRFHNFKRAFSQVENAVNLYFEKGFSDLERQGMIQGFEFTHELAWNVFKDFFSAQGTTTIYGSKDATREAFSKGLIEDGDSWMEMIRGRNLSSHTYNAEVAEELLQKIIHQFFPLFKALKIKMESLLSK